MDDACTTGDYANRLPFLLDRVLPRSSVPALMLVALIYNAVLLVSVCPVSVLWDQPRRHLQQKARREEWLMYCEEKAQAYMASCLCGSGRTSSISSMFPSRGASSAFTKLATRHAMNVHRTTNASITTRPAPSVQYEPRSKQRPIRNGSSISPADLSMEIDHTQEVRRSAGKSFSRCRGYHRRRSRED